MARWVWLFGVVALVSVGVGCSDDDGSEAAEETTSSASVVSSSTVPVSSSTMPVSGYTPVFEPGPCAGEVPADLGAVECGRLVVPADRADPTGATVSMPVWVLSGAPDGPSDPVVFVTGGPGLGAALLVERRGADLLDLAGGRDVVFFDQRGTGQSEPSLDCPEIGDAEWARYGAAAPPEQELADVLDAYGRCRARLVADGVVLDAYDTPTTAQDLADLVEVLGVEEWNLVGVSYGTTVGLEMLRSHGEGLRSVVLDSVYLTTVAPGASNVVAAGRAYELVFESCAADVDCATAYPNLEADAVANGQALNETPYETVVVDAQGQQRPVVVTGADGLQGLIQTIGDATLLPLVPLFINSRAAGDTAVLDAAVQRLAASIGSSNRADGVYASVECADRAALFSPGDWQGALEAFPEYSGVLVSNPFPPLCEVWDVEPVDPSFNQPVTSEIPVLALAGEFDPTTPPADTQEATDTLANATYVEFPALSHIVAFAHECPTSIIEAFLASPTGPVPTGCVADMPPTPWAT